MATRPLDVAAAALALLPAAPICLLAAAGIWLADGSPIVYETRRVGRGGRPFTMYKFRTMRQAAPVGAGGQITGLITANQDRRVFAFGGWLRRWKIDELPQLLNVLRGDMAIVGPRPEDPAIVERYYTPVARETLAVRPGLASPGSIYNFTHGERQLGAAGGADVDEAYGRGLLPRKLALDLAYVRAASPGYDLRIVFRAIVTIVEHGLGRRAFPDPPELARARQYEELLQRPIVPSAELS